MKCRKCGCEKVHRVEHGNLYDCMYECRTQHGEKAELLTRIAEAAGQGFQVKPKLEAIKQILVDAGYEIKQGGGNVDAVHS